MSFTIPGAEEFSGKRVAVVGMGKSGQASVRALADLTGARVSAWDAREESVACCEGIDEAGWAASSEELAEKVFSWRPDIVIPAPAISELSPLFSGARERGIERFGEIELAWRLRGFHDGVAAPWLCVTGTNGKTTTVSMTAAMLEAGGLGGRAIGNIGTPAVVEVTRERDAAGAFAVELSSFQLASSLSLSPVSSVCLNIADDHLEWHGTREAYWAAKSRVYANTRVACVYPVGDSSVQRMVDDADVVEGARAIGYTLGTPGVGQIGLVEDIVVDRAYGDDRHRNGIELFELADLMHLAPGGGDLPVHIMLDALASASLARAAGIAPEAIRAALRGFEGGSHRIEHVATVAGVSYVNDSKATNAHAARASLGAIDDGRTVWIVGGLAKGARFEELVAQMKRKLRGVVVIGVDQEPWKDALAQLPGLPVHYVSPTSTEPMNEAVREAAAMAVAGDTVLMAPACASMDQFVSYAQRGEAFVEAVRNLHE